MDDNNTEADGLLQDDGTELQFRAVTAGGKRRGIRLERIFWDALAAVAAENGRTLGDTVAIAHDQVAKDGNLTSALRVAGARWLRGRLLLFEKATAKENIFAILQACPAPAFVLTADKRIVHYNLPFLNFIQTSFIGVEHAEVMQGLRLSLDIPLETVMAQIGADPTTPVATGFALGVVGRRVRGELKIVPSPTPDNLMVIAFIIRQ